MLRLPPFLYLYTNYVNSDVFWSHPDNLEKFICLDVKIDNSLRNDIINHLKNFENNTQRNYINDIKIVTKAVRSMYDLSNKNYKKNVKLRKLDDILKIDKNYMHICSEFSKVALVFFQILGYESRVIWLEKHTVVEIYVNNSGWVLVDTYWNLTFKRDNNLVSLYEIKNNYNNLILEEILENDSTNENYVRSGRFEEIKEAYTKGKLYVVVESQKIFTLHEIKREFKNLISYILLGSTIVKGIQFIENDYKKVGNFCILFYKRLL